MNIHGATAAQGAGVSATADGQDQRVETRAQRLDRETQAKAGDTFDKIKGDGDPTKVKSKENAKETRDKDRQASSQQAADLAQRLGISMNRARKELRHQQVVARAAEGTPFVPGTPMSQAAAQAKVADIYKTAFPGVQFTGAELAKPVDLLASGTVSETDLRARVTEGARLINDPNAARKEAGKLASGSSDPHRLSIASQQLRVAHLMALMREGVIPEGKFTVTGAFMYVLKGHKTDPVQGRYLHATNATQLGGSSSSGSFPWLSDKERNRKGGSAMEIPKATSSMLSETLSDLSSAGAKTNSPVMLDLNHDGHLGVTGTSTARDRLSGAVNPTVDFDIDGDGKTEHIEWMNGDGDGMLIDDRDGGATAASHGDGVVDGRRLFGDQGGAFGNGYEKLTALDANHDGKLTGHELDGLKAWIDDGDARVEAGELKTLAELGVTELNLKMQLTANDAGETLMRSTFTQNGVEHVSEDVWFGEGDGADNLAATTARLGSTASSQQLGQLIAHLDATMDELGQVTQQAERGRDAATMAAQSRQLLNTGIRA